MIVTDLRIVETKDGGDCILNANDLQLISGFQNMPYIALFGGNVEQSTTGAKDTEQTFDFWGNYLLHPSLQNIWFNSRTEKLLQTVALNSAGRIEIEQQVKTDLECMQEFANITVSVQLISVDRIRIEIILLQPNKLDSTELVYIWDATNAELTEQDLNNGTNVYGVSLNNLLNYDL